MRKSVAIALFVSLLTPLVALAQSGLKVGDWAWDLDAKEWLNVDNNEADIPSLPKLRGLITVIFIWTSQHDGGKYILPVFNELANNDQIGTVGGVVFIGLTDGDAKSTKEMVETKKVLFPVGVESKLYEKYGFEQSWGAVVVDTTGKIAYIGTPTAGWAQQIVELMGKAPPFRTHPSEARLVTAAMREAGKFIAKRDFRKAWGQLFEAMRRTVLGDPLKFDVFSMADMIEQIGNAEIREAEVLVEKGEYRKAADLLRQTNRRLKGFDTARLAKSRIETFSKEHDAFKEALNNYTSEDSGYKLLLQGREDLKFKRVGEAYEKFDKIVKEYPKSEAAGIAQGHIDRMKGIPEVWTGVLNYLARNDCTAWLQQARQLIRQGKRPEAEELLRRVLKEHPGTMYAEEAMAELKRLP